MIHLLDTLGSTAILAICIALFPATLTGCDGSSKPDDSGGEETGGTLSLWEQQSNEQVVFMSKADSAQGELYLVDKQGSITRLTDNDLHENNPSLSPDGSKVAFNAGSESDLLTWEIYVLDLETLEQTRLTDNSVIDAHPDWSPDGERIVFGSFRDTQGDPAGAADIFVMNASNGASLTRLTDSPEVEDNDPEWSPDGSMIVFKSTDYTRQSAREEIHVMDSDGSNPRRLTETSGWESDHDPSWSPSGDRVVYVRYEGDRAWTDGTDPAVLVREWQELTPWNIWTVDLSGDMRRLTDNTEAGWGIAVYSSDSARILYGRLDWITDSENRLIGGLHRLMLMDSDGLNQEQLFPDDAHTGTLEYFDW